MAVIRLATGKEKSANEVTTKTDIHRLSPNKCQLYFCLKYFNPYCCMLVTPVFKKP